jgi:hypothetical protein
MAALSCTVVSLRRAAFFPDREGGDRAAPLLPALTLMKILPPSCPQTGQRLRPVDNDLPAARLSISR